jgi:hypothetical protein
MKERGLPLRLGADDARFREKDLSTGRRPLMDRETAYDGPRIVGMDLHRSRSVLVRMTPDGQRLDRVRIDNSPTALQTEIAKAGPHRRVVLEATCRR